jgi:hypothetical protein
MMPPAIDPIAGIAAAAIRLVPVLTDNYKSSDTEIAMPAIWFLTLLLFANRAADPDLHNRERKADYCPHIHCLK